MQLQLDIRESWGKWQQKDQKEYEAFAQIHGDTIQRSPTPYRKNFDMGTKCKIGAN